VKKGKWRDPRQLGWQKKREILASASGLKIGGGGEDGHPPSLGCRKTKGRPISGTFSNGRKIETRGHLTGREGGWEAKRAPHGIWNDGGKGGEGGT